MKLHSGLVTVGLLSLGLLSYSCANGDTVSGTTGSGTGNGGSTSTGTGGSSSTGTGGTHTGGVSGTGTGGTHTGGSPGTGGTVVTGTGGTHTGGVSGTGTGGTIVTGTGGTIVTGTGGSSSASNCIMGQSNPPMNKLITNFTDAVAATGGTYTFGSTAGDTGGTSLFASSSATKGTLSLVSGGGITFTASVPAMSTADMYPDNGFVVYVNGPGCLNASTYTGVSFTMTTTGTCNFIFSFGDSEHIKASDDPDRGSCVAANCYASQYSVTSATTMVSFAQTATNLGSPATLADPAKFTGVQWQMAGAAGAACSGTITVKNISFF